MSPQASKSRKNNKQARRPALHGKRYELISCPSCGALIYRRHLNTHIQEFHPDRSSTQTIRQSEAGIASINTSDLSPELQEEIKKRYVIDESGFILPYENDKNGLSMRMDVNEEEPEE